MRRVDGLDLRRPADGAPWEPQAARIEDALRQALSEPWSLLNEAALRIARAGGKRVRARLVFAAARAVAPAPLPFEITERLVAAAAAIELLHVGSLIHDDVLDGASERRGVPTINTCNSDAWAILAGDMVLARASRLAARLGAAEATLFSDLLNSLCHGQALETTATRDVSRGEDNYYASIRGKTAALMEGACRIGAMQVTENDASLDAVSQFGFNFGMAFQVLDDVADIVLSEAQLGKPPLQDLRAGVLNLPVILALPQQPSLRALLTSAPLDDDGVLLARDAILATDTPATATDVAIIFWQNATEALDSPAIVGDTTGLVTAVDTYVDGMLRKLADARSVRVTTGHHDVAAPGPPFDVLIDRKIGDVFEFITDIANTWSYNPSVLRAEMITSGPLRVGSQATMAVRLLGQQLNLRWAVIEHDPPTRFTNLVSCAGQVLRVSMDFEPMGDATRARFACSPQSGGLFQVAGRLVSAAIRAQFSNSVAAIKHELEDTPVVTSSRQSMSATRYTSR